MKLWYSQYCFFCHSTLPKVAKVGVIAFEKSSSATEKVNVLKLTESDLKKLAEVKDFIEAQEVDEPLSLKVLCRKFALNEFKLKNGFRLLFNRSPYDYFLELKMAAAKKLLLEADNTIYGIAYTLGYQHASNFCAQFKKRFGVTPKDFRKE